MELTETELKEPQNEASEAPEEPKHLLHDEFSQRFMRSYYAMRTDQDLFEMSVDLLATGQPYMVATNIAREINHKQGKIRFVMSSEKRELMKSSEEDYQVYLNNRLDRLFIEMINRFIDTHPIFPNTSDREATKIRDMMKILFMMLINNGQLGILSYIHTPDYIKPLLEETLRSLNEKVEGIVDEWVSYLEENESKELSSLASVIGMDFFNGSKAIDAFDKYFRDFIPTMKNFEETYDKYLELRATYFGAAVTINIKSLYKYFDISDDTFIKKRNKYLIPEFQKMFTGEDFVEPLKLLVFGQV